MKLDNLFLRVGTGLFLAAQLTACGDNTDDKKTPDTTDDDTDTDTDTDQGLSWELTKLETTKNAFETDNSAFICTGTFKLKEGKTDEPKVNDEIDVFVTFNGVPTAANDQNAVEQAPVAVKAEIINVNTNKNQVRLALITEKVREAGGKLCKLSEVLKLKNIWLAATASGSGNEISGINTSGAVVPQSYKHPLLESATLGNGDANGFKGTFSYTGGLDKAAFNALNLYGIITLTIDQDGTGTGTVTLADRLGLKLNNTTNTQVDFAIKKAHAKAKVGDATVTSGTLAAADADISITDISLDVFTKAGVKIATVTNGANISATNSFVLE